MQTTGLSLEQAPHLSVPVSFFLTVPASMIAAGCLLAFSGAAPFASSWSPSAVLLTHIGTIGVLLTGMTGALYQMTPVIAGTPVPAIRLAHGVHILLVSGLVLFAWRLLGGPVFGMVLASYSLGLALFAFVLPVGWSLANSATRNEIVFGMRLAVLSLAAVATIGLLMARGYSGAAFPGDRLLWTQSHLALALLGWVGALIMSVSWQIIPMFYLATPTGKGMMRSMLALLSLGLVLPCVALLAVNGGGAKYISLAPLPAALVIWVVHPLLTLNGIAKRKRRRSDASLLFWRAGLLSALLLVPLATATIFITDYRVPILFAWIAVWGWAGMIMHGMLTRIVPFLVWFHRIAPLVGQMRVPSMRGLLSQTRMTIGFVAHLASLATGVAAIVSQVDILARVAGILIVVSGISLGSSLYHVVWRSWHPQKS